MKLILKPQPNRESMNKKQLTIPIDLVDKVNQIAADNNTSFNHVVNSIIETCLEKEHIDKFFSTPEFDALEQEIK